MKFRNKGFTLIELIIVVAILAVLTAIVAPNFARYIERSRNAVDMHNARVIADAITTYYAANPDALADLTTACSTGVHNVQVSVGPDNAAIAPILRPALHDAGLIGSYNGDSAARYKTITCKSKAKWIGYRIGVSNYSDPPKNSWELEIYYWGVADPTKIHSSTSLGGYRTGTDPTGFKDAMNGG